MAPRAVTGTDEFLEQISGQLDKLIGILSPEPSVDPEPTQAPADDKPAKAPVKKATAKTRKVTGQ